jgi:hypothetical protein
MDEGMKRKALVASLATLVLGAGSYFALSGNATPLPTQQTTARPDRPDRAGTTSAEHVRPTRPHRPKKPVARPRPERIRQDKPKRERPDRTGLKIVRTKKRPKRQPGA